MSEIYWITRIGELDTLFSIMWTVSLIVVCSGGFAFLMALAVGDDEIDNLRQYVKKITSCLCIVFAIGVIGDIILPSRNDSMLIYGLGSMIDYVQSNDKAKQLPDKAIDALNRYMDEAYKECESKLNLKENKDSL